MSLANHCFNIQELMSMVKVHIQWNLITKWEYENVRPHFENFDVLSSTLVTALGVKNTKVELSV